MGTKAEARQRVIERRRQVAKEINATILPDILTSFRFDEAEGALVNARDISPRQPEGAVAGAEYKPGCRQIMFNGRRLLSKDIIYALKHRTWPDARVWFTDGDQENQHPDNLFLENP